MNDNIDFFIPKCQTNNITETSFGICDDPDKLVKTPAYVSFSKDKEWTAVVKNISGNAVNFTAIDNCVEIRRENGEMDFRCDAMLTNKDNIIFVELKDQKTYGWKKHAVNDQLQTTINRFKESHDIEHYKHKRVFVCNKKHPYFNVSDKTLMSAFFKKNRVRLLIQNEIIIK